MLQIFEDGSLCTGPLLPIKYIYFSPPTFYHHQLLHHSGPTAWRHLQFVTIIYNHSVGEAHSPLHAFKRTYFSGSRYIQDVSEIFLSWGCLGLTSDSAQGSLMMRLGGPYRLTGIEPGSAAGKASLSLRNLWVFLKQLKWISAFWVLHHGEWFQGHLSNI